MAVAIKDMHVRGAGLIGAAAGYGMYLAISSAASENSGSLEAAQAFDEKVKAAALHLISTRPTAVNLEHAVHRQLAAIAGTLSKPT